MDLFSREQQLYDDAVSTLNSAAETIETSHFSKLVDEYEKLLNQFKQYRNMTDAKARDNIPAERHEVLSKAHFDVLTGIYNKRYLEENMERILSTMGRLGDMLSILKIDVDFFKQYNENYGHSMGDECIRSVAEVLKRCLFRGQDFVVRYGGEEFVAILPYTPENGARLVSDRMLEEVRNLKIPHNASSVSEYVTISIGLVTGERNPGGWIPADFFRRVDEALFQAKNRGRNQYAFLGLRNKD
ncbi:MAG: GGDEF domain-containing protein [Defluviitaleaceae bacterium]|nr:GGDEF domain-containing protein [Defluviitaleaceae bacterium]